MYKNPPICPHKPTYPLIRFFLNKSLLQSYRYFYVLSIFNSAVLAQIFYTYIYFSTADSLRLAELKSVGIFKISQSVLKILPNSFYSFNPNQRGNRGKHSNFVQNDFTP